MKLLKKIREKLGFENRDYVNKTEKNFVISSRREAIMFEYKTFQAKVDEKLYKITVYFEEKETRKEEITEFVRENCNRGMTALIIDTDVIYDLRLETHRSMRENQISLFFSEM